MPRCSEGWKEERLKKWGIQALCGARQERRQVCIQAGVDLMGDKEIK